MDINLCNNDNNDNVKTNSNTNSMMKVTPKSDILVNY